MLWYALKSAVNIVATCFILCGLAGCWPTYHTLDDVMRHDGMHWVDLRDGTPVPDSTLKDVQQRCAQGLYDEGPVAPRTVKVYSSPPKRHAYDKDGFHENYYTREETIEEAIFRAHQESVLAFSRCMREHQFFLVLSR